jgi:hypothetical protein
MEELTIGLYENRGFADLTKFFLQVKKLDTLCGSQFPKKQSLQFWLQALYNSVVFMDYSPTTSNSISVVLLPPKSIVAL